MNQNKQSDLLAVSLRLMAALLQDVSRLVDICRQTIYFDTLEGVRQCLNQMDNDREVQLVH